MKRIRSLGFLIVLGSLGSLSCADSEAPATAPAAPTAKLSASDLAKLDSKSWVPIYDPARAWNGYTLDFYKRRLPILTDMNGRIVHSWPTVRTKSRIRLLEDCSLLAITLGKEVAQYDWEGTLQWQYRIENGYAHHDLIRLANGNTLILIREKKAPADDLLEVTPGGEVVWEWKAEQYLADYFPDPAEHPKDITHVNSVQELPSNPWYDQGDQRFRPGNILISARNLHAVFVIDKETKKAVWVYDEQLDSQHEAAMIGPGLPGHGNIQIFNNGSKHFYTYRQSAVTEINPIDKSVVWDYRSEDFFSPTGGVQQALPNGNVLIASSLGGRAFEVARDGAIVWEWTPPFKVKRPSRYAYDYCPQLESLGRPVEERVRPPEDYRHVDAHVYKFGRKRKFRDRSPLRKVRIDKKMKVALKDNNDCRDLLLPAAAKVKARFSLDRASYLGSPAAGYPVRFRLEMRVEETREVFTLFDQIMERPATRQTPSIDLDQYAYERVRLCVATAVVGYTGDLPTEEFAYWGNPQITSRSRIRARLPDVEDFLPGLNEEELEIQRQHLKALGYID